MSENIVKILSDLELSGSMSFKTNYAGFPANPKPRTLAVVNGVPHLYTELVNGSGFFSWTPIGFRQAAYLHTQGVASTIWTVSHNFNTENFSYFVYDADHRLMIADIDIVDANTFTVNLTEAITGTVVVFSMESVFTQMVNAADSINISTITLRDAAGKLTVNNNEVAMQVSLNTEIAARIAGDTSTLTTAKAYTDSAIAPAVKMYLGAYDGDIIPTANVTYNLGSLTKQWHSLYVGPGTLYVNGKAVIQDNSDTMTFSTDANQNMRIQTSGSGHLELQAATGTIDVKGTLSIESGKRIVDSAGTAVEFGDNINLNGNKLVNIGAPTAAGDAATMSYVQTLTTSDATIVRTAGAQTIAGEKTFSDSLIVTGNLTVNGTMTTVNSETLKLADNLIDLNSNFTTGNPTENAGIRILRGDEPASQVRWNESTDKWEITADSVVYSAIATTADVAAEAALRITNDATTLSSAQAYTNTTATSTLTSAQSFTTAAVATEASARTAADATVLDSANTYAAGLSSTATASINTVASNLASEVTRATASEAGLRANAATLSSNLASEVTRATTAEGVIAADLLSIETQLSATDESLANAINSLTANQYTDADARLSISVTGAGSYNSTTGVITVNADAVTSVAGKTGVVALVQADVGGLTTASAPAFAGITVPSITKSGTNGTGDIGQSTNTFGTVYATVFSGVSTTAKYADLAENYAADAMYAPGTVVMFGGEQEVTLGAADTQAVAGVITTNPAHLMNSEIVAEFTAAVALQGRVPCRVIGAVAKGDLMVSAGNGFAKANNDAKIGQVIGKALSSNASGESVIEVVVGRV